MCGILRMWRKEAHSIHFGVWLLKVVVVYRFTQLFLRWQCIEACFFREGFLVLSSEKAILFNWRKLLGLIMEALGKWVLAEGSRFRWIVHSLGHHRELSIFHCKNLLNKFNCNEDQKESYPKLWLIDHFDDDLFALINSEWSYWIVSDC